MTQVYMLSLSDLLIYEFGDRATSHNITAQVIGSGQAVGGGVMGPSEDTMNIGNWKFSLHVVQ